MDKAEYEKLLQNSVTKAYKKCRTNIKTTIDFEAKEIATNLDFSDSIAQLSEKDALITLKDHKENFQNNPTCRLINPAKSEMGRIISFIPNSICDTN